MTEEQYRNVLNNIAGSFGRLKDQVNQAFEIGRALGLTDMQIGNDVRSKIKGLMSTSTIQRMLPETAKHQERNPTRNKPVVKLTTQPTIPSPPQPIIEIEPEPPKAIDRPIAIPDRRIKLDTAKFRSDLRIALINGDKIWLKYNSQNEVIEITER